MVPVGPSILISPVVVLMESRGVVALTEDRTCILAVKPVRFIGVSTPSTFVE
jgi:hypothetical protein